MALYQLCAREEASVPVIVVFLSVGLLDLDRSGNSSINRGIRIREERATGFGKRFITGLRNLDPAFHPFFFFFLFSVTFRIKFEKCSCFQICSHIHKKLVFSKNIWGISNHVRVSQNFVLKFRKVSVF